MTSPNADTPTPNNWVGFGALLNDAAFNYAQFITTAAHALQNGVDPNQVVAYVRGEVDAPVRREVEQMLARSPWALNRVVALTKSRRRPGSLGDRLLSTYGELDPYAWGIQRTDDPEADLARLLDQV